MKYMIIILIIIVKRLGEILLSYIAHTSRTHALTHLPSVDVVSITALHGRRRCQCNSRHGLETSHVATLTLACQDHQVGSWTRKAVRG